MASHAFAKRLASVASVRSQAPSNARTSASKQGDSGEEDNVEEEHFTPSARLWMAQHTLDAIFGCSEDKAWQNKGTDLVKTSSVSMEQGANWLARPVAPKKKPKQQQLNNQTNKTKQTKTHTHTHKHTKKATDCPRGGFLHHQVAVRKMTHE